MIVVKLASQTSVVLMLTFDITCSPVLVIAAFLDVSSLRMGNESFQAITSVTL